jgi:hypothetical protein
MILVLIYGCSKPEPIAVESGEIDTSQDPIQSAADQDYIIFLGIEDGIFELTPMAEYKASVMVMGKESYSYGWMGQVVPIDLALAWGKLTEPQYDEHINYSQGDRYYFFEYDAESPLDAGYIGKHSANNHIIPATENILKALKSIKKKQKVVLEGYLVFLNGTYKGEKVFWNSSLTRDDHGDNSCELFYVERARIGDFVYE